MAPLSDTCVSLRRQRHAGDRLDDEGSEGGGGALDR